MHITNNGFYIPLTELTQDKLNNLISDLTVEPAILDYSIGKKEKKDNSYKLFNLTNTHIIIPIYYGIKTFGSVDYNVKLNVCDFKFIGKLRDYQVPIVDKCLAYIKENGGGLLSIPCGGGKTSMALYIASILKLKTLVVVHKTFLQDQWIDRIKQFTDAKPGIIRRNTVDIDNKDIVIGMIQSISKKDYNSEIFKQFSFIIYDESHHCASKVFSRSLMKTVGRYTLSLSATPYRSDKLINVMHWFLGNTMYRVKFKINPNVIVKCFHFYCNNLNFKEKKRYIAGDVRPDVISMLSNLCEINDRTLALANIINTIRKDKDRKILILSDRKNHLAALKDLVDQDIKNNNDDNDVVTSYYIGDMKQEERIYAEVNADILFATYHLAKEGLDIERLNTVILATSQKDVIQSVGRIMRKILANGDLCPLIIDFSDDLSVFINHTKQRKQFYRKCEYLIEDYYIYNSNVVSEKDYDNMTQSLENTTNNIKTYDKILETKRINLADIIKVEDVIIMEGDEDENKNNENNNNNNIQLDDLKNKLAKQQTVNQYKKIILRKKLI